MKAKLKRFLTSLLPVSSRRRGQCIDCGACCRLPTPCIFLGSREDGGSYCRVYSFRPPSCRKYPRTQSEFITQDNCGFWFEGQTEKARVPVAVVQFYPTRTSTSQTAHGFGAPAHSPRGVVSFARKLIAVALAQAGFADIRSQMGSKSD